MMIILIFASLTPDTTANYFVRNLRSTENEIYVFSDVESPFADYVIDNAPDVFALCAKYNIIPDLLLFIEGGSMKLFPQGLEKLKCITAWYGIDTHMDYPKHLAIARVFDVSFIAQKEFVERFKFDGIMQVSWLPLAFEPSLKSGIPFKKDYLISYVGSDNAIMHPERHQLIKTITDKFKEVWFGRATPVEMSDIYARSFMVFNKSVNNDVNMRYFEAMGEGAVLLTDRAVNNGVEDLFTEGKHYLEYLDADHLVFLIKQLKDHPSKAIEIGENARSIVKEKHTYNHRVRALLKTIETSKKVASPQPVHYFDILLRLDMFKDSLKFLDNILSNTKTGRINTPLKILLSFSIKLVLYCGKILFYAQRMISRH